MRQFLVDTVERMELLGALFSTIAKPSDVFALNGDLGAGKTTFVRGFVKQISETVHVQSPSFVLIREYSSAPPVYHCDMYRLMSSEEAVNIGIEDYFYSNGITFVEWADNISDILPQKCITLTLTYTETQQRIVECSFDKTREKDIESVYEHFSS